MLLRSMQQAIYTGTNSGHFGLAYEAYTHFTSPIRRYPDLLVHRVIKALLHGKRYHLLSGALEEAPKARQGGKALRAPNDELEHWEATGAHCSANERRADEASRDVEAWLKCRYMREHLGEEFGGTVSAVTSFGLFVTLDALYVEGLVHITELGGEYFRFDEARQELRGERTGVRYAVGSRVRVQVSRVDLDGRKIDFRMVREGEDDASRLRAKRERAGATRPRAPAANWPRVEGDRPRRQGGDQGRKTRAARRVGAHPVRAAKSTARKALRRRAAASAAERGSGVRRRGRAICSIRSAARSTGSAGVHRPRCAVQPGGVRRRRARRARSASASSRCDQRPPIQPASTSPVPAVASAALPVALMRGVRPGAATTEPEPLSTTTQREALGQLLRGAPRRSACTSLRVEPSRRAASSGCGVSTRGAAARARALRSSCCSDAVGGDGVQRVGIQHQAAGASSAGAAARRAPRRRRRSRRPRWLRASAAASACWRPAAAQHQLGPLRVERPRRRIQQLDDTRGRRPPRAPPARPAAPRRTMPARRRPRPRRRSCPCAARGVAWRRQRPVGAAQPGVGRLAVRCHAEVVEPDRAGLVAPGAGEQARLERQQAQRVRRRARRLRRAAGRCRRPGPRAGRPPAPGRAGR